MQDGEEIDLQAKFRNLLKEDFERRRSENPRFSLREYAKAIDLRVSALSEILSGKRNVSAKMAQKVFDNMGAPKKTVMLFLKEFNFINHKPAFYSLDEDRFKLIYDFKYFSLLALMETKGFISDEKWIAERLQLSIDSIKEAIQALLDLELINRDVWGELSLSQTNLQSPDQIPSEANKKSHLQGLALAEKHLQLGELEERDFTGMIIPLCPTLLPKVRAKIRALYQDLSLLSESAPKKEVYRVNIQVFPITQVRKRKK